MDKADFIGKRVRALRQANKFSQERLAEALNVSTQQMHKYETGKNRIPIDKLIGLAMKFNVDLNYFADMNAGCTIEMVMRQTLSDEEKELLRIYRNIKEKERKKSLLIIMKEISKCIKQNE